VAIAGAGISLHPNDPEALAGAFLELADAGPAVRTQMGAAGRAYVVREHDISSLSETLDGIVTTAAT
jgi:glycosyltransferase involved in cell wall biosynthesis